MGVRTRDLIGDYFDDGKDGRCVGRQSDVCGDGGRLSIEGSTVEVWIIGLCMRMLTMKSETCISISGRCEGQWPMYGSATTRVRPHLLVGH